MMIECGGDVDVDVVREKGRVALETVVSTVADLNSVGKG